jgi:hypothetical protein
MWYARSFEIRSRSWTTLENHQKLDHWVLDNGWPFLVRWPAESKMNIRFYLIDHSQYDSASGWQYCSNNSFDQIHSLTFSWSSIFKEEHRADKRLCQYVRFAVVHWNCVHVQSRKFILHCSLPCCSRSSMSLAFLWIVTFELHLSWYKAKRVQLTRNWNVWWKHPIEECF